jgi:alkanesulfonate monooxygenase SsuD/methylene tetrahydromethanopterin reductase-like flavin-dependent oxidoreductase (luciferase family)
MKFEVVLSNLGQLANPSTLAALACRAEELGFDGVFLSAHLKLVGLRA